MKNRGSRWIAYRDRTSGLTFMFKTDPDAPDLLHIYARHLTTERDAVGTILNGERLWNRERQRWES